MKERVYMFINDKQIYFALDWQAQNKLVIKHGMKGSTWQ